MSLLLIRHAVAWEREKWAKKSNDDSLRPLTKKGKNKFKLSAQGISLLIPELSKILTSPFVRALDTATILSAYYKKIPFKVLNSPYPQMSQLQKYVNSTKTIAFVGHEPHLSQLLGDLLHLNQTFPVPFKKGGIALVGPGKNGPELKIFMGPSYTDLKRI